MHSFEALYNNVAIILFYLACHARNIYKLLTPRTELYNTFPMSKYLHFPISGCSNQLITMLASQWQHALSKYLIGWVGDYQLSPKGA